jgi:hypothetical protein
MGAGFADARVAEAAGGSRHLPSLVRREISRVL